MRKKTKTKNTVIDQTLKGQSNVLIREVKDLRTDEIEFRRNLLAQRIEMAESQEVVLQSDLTNCRKTLRHARADAAVLEALVESRR